MRSALIVVTARVASADLRQRSICSRSSSAAPCRGSWSARGFEAAPTSERRIGRLRLRWCLSVRRSPSCLRSTFLASCDGLVLRRRLGHVLDTTTCLAGFGVVYDDVLLRDEAGPCGDGAVPVRCRRRRRCRARARCRRSSVPCPFRSEPPAPGLIGLPTGGAIAPTFRTALSE